VEETLCLACKLAYYHLQTCRAVKTCRVTKVKAYLLIVAGLYCWQILKVFSEVLGTTEFMEISEKVPVVHTVPGADWDTYISLD
jgi:hypothetical protein